MEDLITLEEYKILEGLNKTDEDAKLAILISSVSQLVKTYCSNSIVDRYDTPEAEEYTLLLPTDGIQLNEGPVREVTLVEERSSPTEAYTTLDTTEWTLSKASDIVYRVSGNQICYWPTGPEVVRITYSAGYAETPADLKLAVADLVTYYRKNEHKERRQLSGASVANQGTTSQWRNVDFPDHIKRVLDFYKQIYV